MFDSLFDDLTSILKINKGKILEIPEEFKNHYNKTSNAYIKNWLFELPLYRKWRITRLDCGDKLQVFNTVAYPIFKSEKPFLGIDILWFANSNKLIAVLDFQPLIQDKKYLEKYCSSLDVFKKKYCTFDNQTMKNIYDSTKYFSPWVIICRGNKSHLDRDLNDVFTLFLNLYLKMDEHIIDNYFLNEQEIQKKQFEYDSYSIERDPADKLFRNFFGDIWTEKFIHNFLFTLD